MNKDKLAMFMWSSRNAAPIIYFAREMGYGIDVLSDNEKFFELFIYFLDRGNRSSLTLYLLNVNGLDDMSDCLQVAVKGSSIAKTILK